MAKDGVVHTIQRAKELCQYYWQADIPVYIHGAPGLGKSDAARQLAQAASVGFKDVRMAQMLPEDINGIPVPDLENRIAVWLTAEFWPNHKRDGKRGIIIFDELSDCARNIQSAAYQVILDRKGIPEGWWPMAAGNRREDRAAAQGLSTALANRFAHLDVEADVDAWVLWANSHGIHHFVIGFIRYRPKLLHNMEGTDLRAFPTPRSWAQVSKVCETPASVRYHLMAGLVGDGAAGEFEHFMKTLDLPDLKDILANPKKCPIPKQPASRYALSSMLATRMTRDNMEKICQYTRRDEFGRDFEICCMLDATKRDTGLCETKAFVDFANNNQDLTLS